MKHSFPTRRSSDLNMIQDLFKRLFDMLEAEDWDHVRSTFRRMCAAYAITGQPQHFPKIAEFAAPAYGPESKDEGDDAERESSSATGDRTSTRLNSSHYCASRMPTSA